MADSVKRSVRVSEAALLRIKRYARAKGLSVGEAAERLVTLGLNRVAAVAKHERMKRESR